MSSQPVSAQHARLGRALVSASPLSTVHHPFPGAHTRFSSNPDPSPPRGPLSPGQSEREPGRSAAQMGQLRDRVAGGSPTAMLSLPPGPPNFQSRLPEPAKAPLARGGLFPDKPARPSVRPSVRLRLPSTLRSRPRRYLSAEIPFHVGRSGMTTHARRPQPRDRRPTVGVGSKLGSRLHLPLPPLLRC